MLIVLRVVAPCWKPTLVEDKDECRVVYMSSGMTKISKAMDRSMTKNEAAATDVHLGNLFLRLRARSSLRTHEPTMS